MAERLLARPVSRPLPPRTCRRPRRESIQVFRAVLLATRAAIRRLLPRPPQAARDEAAVVCRARCGRKAGAVPAGQAAAGDAAVLTVAVAAGRLPARDVAVAADGLRDGRGSRPSGHGGERIRSTVSHGAQRDARMHRPLRQPLADRREQRPRPRRRSATRRRSGSASATAADLGAADRRARQVARPGIPFGHLVRRHLAGDGPVPGRPAGRLAQQSTGDDGQRRRAAVHETVVDAQPLDAALERRRDVRGRRSGSTCGRLSNRTGPTCFTPSC